MFCSWGNNFCIVCIFLKKGCEILSVLPCQNRVCYSAVKLLFSRHLFESQCNIFIGEQGSSFSDPKWSCYKLTLFVETFFFLTHNKHQVFTQKWPTCREENFTNSTIVFTSIYTSLCLVDSNMTVSIKGVLKMFISCIVLIWSSWGEKIVSQWQLPWGKSQMKYYMISSI